MDYLLLIAMAAVFLIIIYKGTARHDRLMRDGRPVMATIENVTPVSSDDAGNTTIVYTLNIEGRHVKGKEKIDTFFSPQFQPGMQIKIMYINDEDYMFVFKK
ncbi:MULTISPECIES: hypothetical protein [Kosakonia]|uniref:hypothetical protein n=1 Tax=Kosakonia TaxID=1330547 RepID=UPI0005F04A36|nr:MULTISPECIES: hypothetical protein [Kosakonia]QHM94561.1 hypothetical protein FGE25_09850 [Kosakonia sacchari]RCX01451.1 hypothetical protein DFO56_104156 [Kosakonia sp. AG348]